MHSNNTDINIMIRIFHWFLVVLFVTLFITGNNNNEGGAIHIISGYLLTSFVLARIVWGFMGDKNALWHHYLYNPKSIFNYLLKPSNLTPIKSKPHNPAGNTIILINDNYTYGSNNKWLINTIFV